MNEELVSALKETVAALDAAAVPDDLRREAFRPTFEWLTAGQPPSSRATGTELAARSAPASPAGSAQASVSSRFSAIGRELELEPELVERLFDELGDDELQFIGSPERLGTSKQMMVESIAVLLCAARAAGGYDADGRTPDKAIRSEIERHGLYDVTNYSKHTKRLRQLANPNGSGRSMTYKLKYEGRMRARELAALATAGHD